MQSSGNCQVDEVSPLPASGLNLSPAIAQAISQLHELSVRRDFGHEGWPDPAKLWCELLKQSQDRSSRDVAPNVLKGDIAAPTGIRLDGRHWKSFQKWFGRYVAPELLKLSENSGVPAIQAVRRSNPRGGFPDKSESVFFLAFLEPKISLTVQPASQSNPPVDLKLEDQLGNQQLNQTERDKRRAARQSERGTFWQRVVSCIPGISASAEPSTEDSGAAVQRRWRFGVSTVLFGISLVAVCGFFPVDFRRGIFITFSIGVLFLGFWDMDQANKGRARRPFYDCSGPR